MGLSRWKVRKPGKGELVEVLEGPLEAPPTRALGVERFVGKPLANPKTLRFSTRLETLNPKP